MKDRIKAVRKKFGLTQAEFSVKLGLSPTSAAAWEKKDAQIPTESMQLLICRTFGINKEWLESGIGEMEETRNKSLLDTIADSYNLSDLERDVISVFLEMDDSQKKVFLEMARVLKK